MDQPPFRIEAWQVEEYVNRLRRHCRNLALIGRVRDVQEFVNVLSEEPTAVLESNGSIPREKWTTLGFPLTFVECSALEMAAGEVLAALEGVWGRVNDLQGIDGALQQLEVALWRFLYSRDVPLVTRQAEIVGRNLRRLMEMADCTTAELGAESGVSETSIKTALAGKTVLRDLDSIIGALKKRLKREILIEEVTTDHRWD